MVIGITEDFTSTVVLDSELKATPTSGLYVNSGVHPSITVDNLLSFLPYTDMTFAAWDNAKTYGVFKTSKNTDDIVVKDDIIYESIQSGTNQDPASESDYWLETNIESLRLKSFIDKVMDKVKSDLNLTKRLVNNQYLYEVGKNEVSLSGDYAAWVFEPKGSDYVNIRINEISIQKSGSTPIDVYIINQGVLVDTINLTPNDGVLQFTSVDYSLTGKGAFYIAIDSTDVLTGGGYIDPLRFDGFTAYTARGEGDAPETANYSFSNSGNGLGFNISAELDSSVYIDNNIRNFGAFIRSVFEYMVFQTFLHNPNNRSNRQETIQMKEEILLAELKNTKADTVVSRYYRERKKAFRQLEKTFDTQLHDNDDIEIEVTSV